MGSLPVEPALESDRQEDQTDRRGVRFPGIPGTTTLPVMPELHARVDGRVVAALDALAHSSGAPRDHLVERALAEYLGVEHHTLYQVSTAGALVEGVYQGAVSVGVVREHGDFGLGTFEDLDGEMVVLGGHVFRVGSDGAVGEVRDDARTPFAVVTRFGDPPAVTVDARSGFADLTAAIDGLRRSANVFAAVRVDGHFDAVHAPPAGPRPAYRSRSPPSNRRSSSSRRSPAPWSASGRHRTLRAWKWPATTCTS
jgi:hypothetical protein